MNTIQQKFLEELKALFDKYKVVLDGESMYEFDGEDEFYSGEIYTIISEDSEINIEINDLQIYLMNTANEQKNSKNTTDSTVKSSHKKT